MGGGVTKNQYIGWDYIFSIVNPVFISVYVSAFSSKYSRIQKRIGKQEPILMCKISDPF